MDLQKNAVGLVLGSAITPERLVPTAMEAEAHGFDEVWFSEDMFFTGGISGATAALASTSRINVGLGIVSALVRHPAILAMELATMARAFPGRVYPGIGLGVPAWLRQVGLLPSSPLGAVRDCVVSVRQLLAGDELTSDGRQFSFDGVALAHPVPGSLPIYMGVIGPRMLQVAGEIADGSVLSVGAGVEYVRWARAQIDAGRERANRSDAHRITVFALYASDADRHKAREAVRGPLAFYKSAGGVNAMTEVEGLSETVRSMVERGGAEVMAREMPEQWIDDLTIAGTPQECAQRISSLFAAGADSVALFPVSADSTVELARRTGQQVLPLLPDRVGPTPQNDLIGGTT